jgi:hypothetical protein
MDAGLTAPTFGNGSASFLDARPERLPVRYQPRPEGYGNRSKSHILKRHGKRSHRPHLKWPHLARPIKTPASIELFFELYDKHTSSCRTSWDEMAVEWNTRLGGSHEVLGELAADTTLHFTTLAYLRKFEESLVFRRWGKRLWGIFQLLIMSCSFKPPTQTIPSRVSTIHHSTIKHV